MSGSIWASHKKRGVELAPRRKHDFYPTPLEFAQYAVNHLLPAEFSPRHIIDPGAGPGVWGRAARGRYPQALITGVELRAIPKPPYYHFWYNRDFRSLAHSEIADLVIGNPPYKYSLEFVTKSLEMLCNGGYLLFLLRFQFAESLGRLPFFKQYPPVTVYISSRRISFTADGRSDSALYGVFVWRKGDYESTRLEWFDYQGESSVTQLMLDL